MVLVKSACGTKTLTVLPCGRCSFENGSDRKEKVFEVVEFANTKCLRSSSRNLLLQFQNEHYGNFYCLNMDHEDTRTIVFKSNNHIHPLVWCISAGVVGAVLVPAMGLGAAALVPAAMTTFGTVVSGVGTINAPLAAGGVAAMLQAGSTALMTSEAAAGGAAIGVALGLFKAKKNDRSIGPHEQDAPNSTDSDGLNPSDEQKPDGNEEGEDQLDVLEEPKNSDSQSPGEFS